jgi:hypothetical protein
MQQFFRTITLFCICSVSILFLPWWVQIVCFACVVWIARYPLVFLVLAAVPDTVFSVHSGFHFAELHLFCITGLVLLARFLALRYTRLAIHYEKEN